MKYAYRVFILTMPNNNSWNNKWTGNNKLYCIVKKYGQIDEILKNVDRTNSHYYNFGDGWSALVEIKDITSDEAKIYRKRSKGFSGYSWMVDEIEKYGRILTRSERVYDKKSAANNI